MIDFRCSLNLYRILYSVSFELTNRLSMTLYQNKLDKFFKERITIMMQRGREAGVGQAN